MQQEVLSINSCTSLVLSLHLLWKEAWKGFKVQYNFVCDTIYTMCNFENLFTSWNIINGAPTKIMLHWTQLVGLTLKIAA